MSITCKPDFEALFRASPYPYLVMGIDLSIIDANDAYLRSVGRARSDLIGRYVFDAFPPNPGDPDSVNIAAVKASLETAIATGLPHTTSFLRYAVPKPDGTFDERYWSTVHTPAFGEDGKVAFVFQNAIDVTDLYRFDRSSSIAAVNLNAIAVRDEAHFNRAQMQEAMRRILSDERGHLRNLFNQTPGFVAILSGPKFVFEMVNEAYYQLVGHREILGKPVWEALPEVAGQGFEELLDGVYQTGEPWSGQGIKVVVQRDPNGPFEERFIDLVYKPYHAEDGTVVGIFAQGHDVTEAFEAQAARQESEERLKEGMIAAKMIVWDWEVSSRKIYFSGNVTEVLGGIAPETIDLLYECIHPDDRKKMAVVHQTAIAERSGYRETLRFTRKDNGKVMWLDVYGKVRCNSAGVPLAIRGVTLDISERVAAEEELRNADKRKDEFLAMLAHELRNPLAPISSAAHMMKMGGLDKARLEQTSAVILRQIDHMAGLVDDLIDVSRVTRGLITIEKSKVDLRRVIADAIEQTGPLLERKDQRLKVELSPEPAHVLGDHKRLVQVVANLLNNATKYTPVSGSIRLRMRSLNARITITVEDDGIGISSELLPQVFELFTQGERASDRTQGGLGVGLALVKSLVELHGGDVEASSEGANKGSMFTVKLLPLDFDERPGAVHTAPADMGPAKPFQIMIVDDNLDAANMLSMYLEQMGHQVVIENSANSALARVESVSSEIFLLDIGLPGMDGNALAKRLRSHPKTRNAVLIAITGYGQDRDRQTSKSAGFDYHLVKPANGPQLVALLAEIAGRASVQSGV